MKKYKYTAKIEEGEGGGAHVFFPYNTAEEFGTEGRVAVKATFDGIEYAGSLMNYGHAHHMLGILKSIRQQLKKGPGDTVEVVVWKDQAERTLEVPPDFEALLKQDNLLPAFDKLSYTHRKEYCRWISEAKRQETKEKRLAKAVEMLKAGVKTPG